MKKKKQQQIKEITTGKQFITENRTKRVLAWFIV